MPSTVRRDERAAPACLCLWQYARATTRRRCTHYAPG